MVSFHLLSALMILTDSALCLFWVASARLWATDWHSRDKLSNSLPGQESERLQKWLLGEEGLHIVLVSTRLSLHLIKLLTIEFITYI